jgi:hypothetical protein
MISQFVYSVKKINWKGLIREVIVKPVEVPATLFSAGLCGLALIKERCKSSATRTRVTPAINLSYLFGTKFNINIYLL